ncbi:aspartate aminotransferase family protein [Microbacterium sp. MC2]
MTANLDVATDEQRKRVAVLPRTYRLFYRVPVMVDRADGAVIYEPDGTRLVDGYNNVPVVGHSNPVVAERVAQQLLRSNTHTRYLVPGIADFAGRLLNLFEDHLDRVIFTSSGSEANDLAVQVARAMTGNDGVIVTSHAYHGTTAALRDLSPSLSGTGSDDRTGLIELPPDAGDIQAFGAGFLARLDEQIQRLKQSGVGVAALLIDSLMTSDGIHPLPLGLLSEAASRVRAAGGVWIADEVQSGYGRTGAWWGYQRHEGDPDLVVLGKPMGNGLPIAALVGRHSLLDGYGDHSRYFNTFGGNPVCVAAADAVLDEIETRDLRARAVSLGARLADGLSAAFVGAGIPVRVRGAGLMIGVDTGTRGLGPLISDLMREEGVLVGTCGVEAEVLKVRPPLVVDEAQIDEIAAAASRALRRGEFLDAVRGVR